MGDYSRCGRPVEATTADNIAAVEAMVEEDARNAAGTGRASKANTKKATAQPNAITPSSTPDPYALNHRLQPPSASSLVRQKPPNWNMNLCPTNTFPSGGMMSPTGGMPVGGCEVRTGCGSPLSFSSVSGANGLLMRPNSRPNVSVANYGGGNTNNSMMPVPSPNDPNARLSASPRQPPYGMQPVPGSQSQQPQPQQQQQQQQQYFPPGTTGPPVSSPSFYVTGPAANNFLTHQQPPMQQRTPPGSTMSYTNTVPAGRPQQNTMHFQQHPMPQPTGSYSTGPLGRPVCGQPSAGYPNTAPVPEGTPATLGRLASPGPIAIPSSTGDTDRLVCPITNGMVWGPTQIQLTDVMQQFLPDGVYVRRFEFDLTANHLQTIVGRTDLDIVVCSHLVSEPLQVCHWPSDAVQIRFNEYLLRLDRSSVHGGQSAHKVACVKQLCRPGRNQLEIAIVGLGEDPNQPSTMSKRRAASSTLETVASTADSREG
ncbi:unnamed protein product [Echinostoma caproni]|uniref:SP-RING-type domain-containing protein n=1 Tax=Echinostoma caproni TaxID=27848 RepID=A0A183A7S3_9TREM|nr:unnamed protein product [Echinostoma caproni]